MKRTKSKMSSSLVIITCYKKIPTFSFLLFVFISVTVLVLGLANSNRILSPSSYEESIKNLILKKVNNKSSSYYREIPNLDNNNNNENGDDNDYPRSIPPVIAKQSPPSAAASLINDQFHRPPPPPLRPPIPMEELPDLPPPPPQPDDDIKRRLLSLFSKKVQQQHQRIPETTETLSSSASDIRPWSSPETDFDYFTPSSEVPSSSSSTTTPPPPPLSSTVASLNLSTNSQKIAQLFRELIDSRSSTGPTTSGSCGDQSLITISTNYEISSPNYPEPYPPNLHCIWNIQAQKDQLLKVQIFKLHLEHDDNCRFDRLDIKGVHQLDKKTGKTVIRTKRFCGIYSRGREFDIGTNHTTIEFHSDSYNQYPGFHLRIIAQSQDCLYELFINNYSYITSPNYPEPYEDSKNCWTLVQTHQNHRLLVNFEDLHLESDIRCEFDFVEIFDSSNAKPERSLGRFCTFPPQSSLFIHSTDNSLLFHFESDNFLALRGYKAKIITLRKDVNIKNYMDCDWNADWNNMTITSPEPYPIGSHCETSISAPTKNERIILLFDWIDLLDDNKDDVVYHLGSNTEIERSTPKINHRYRMFNCSMDRLEIYERLNDTEPSNVFCGQHSQPFRYVSQTDSIRLVFRSVEIPNQDRIRTGGGSQTPAQGFRAKFTFMAISDKNGTKTELKSTTNNNKKSSITISKLSKPDGHHSKWPVLIRRPENASVRLGSSHILYCEVGQNGDNDDGSVPAATTPIIWFKGDREIHDGVSDNGTSLLIRQFNPNSVGRYICVYGDNSSDAWLTLKRDTEQCTASNVLFRERPRDQFTSEGEFVMLHCSATLAHNSNQDVEIKWERLPLLINPDDDNDERLRKKPQPVIYNSRIKKLSRGDLLFDRVLVEDSGYYFCVVRLDHPWSNFSSNAKIDDDDDCVIKSVARVQINRRVDVRDFCGISTIGRNNDGNGGQPENIADVGKIIGGTEAQPGEFPWMVMFWDEKRHVFCGGALLNERWVVTAAHCFTDILDEATVFVKLGKYDQTETEPTELVTKIQHTIKHPHFSNETFDNDIALVKLTTHIQFTDHIRPICMATSSEEVRQMNSFFFSADYPSANSQRQTNRDYGDSDEESIKFGYVTGWGRLKENGPLPRYLHKIRLPLVGRDKCRQSTTFKVTDNMFCAGYGKEIVGDACKGDSGGPFVVEWHSHWTLLGIVSWGEGCGRPGKYGYYTRVNNYDNWIRRLTAIN